MPPNVHDVIFNLEGYSQLFSRMQEQSIEIHDVLRFYMNKTNRQKKKIKKLRRECERYKKGLQELREEHYRYINENEVKDDTASIDSDETRLSSQEL